MTNTLKRSVVKESEIKHEENANDYKPRGHFQRQMKWTVCGKVIGQFLGKIARLAQGTRGLEATSH